MLRKYLEDVLLLAGCGLIVTGVHQIYPPAAWIVAGAMLIGIAVLVGKAKADASE